MSTRVHTEIDSTDPFERGRQRGVQVAARLRETWPIYQSLFAVTARDAGRSPVDVPATAESCLDAVSTWSPELLRELEGVAAGSGFGLTTVMALNARTEVLAQARSAGATECSTLVQLHGGDGSPIGAQTWDWHEELAGGWHLHTVRGDDHTFVGLTEYGMLAKIGVNDAGLGVHLNLLRHASDARGRYDNQRARPAGGVPVHLLARQILGRAASVAEAVEHARSAAVCASSVITVVSREEAVCVEISPAGVGLVEPSDGWLVHTNHFLEPRLAAGERVTEEVTTTFEREDLLRSRVKAVAAPLEVEELAALLCAHDEDGVPVCRHPDGEATLGYRGSTLATVSLDPLRCAAGISAGGPCRRTEVTTLAARP
ncbi:MAG: isopenicillin-N N-acyltransferase like protein [Nocardioidaceae bacterium]|jgi:isopenicillin-N N-acyltransferase-like protein|nr:isopenicillin-N N-acyltransferase like protein [Nocardioidaceae bacterium]